MRQPPPDPKSSGKKQPAAPEPPQGRAMERARQFAVQRGLPPPAADAQPKESAAGGKTPPRKKP
jgi:hypothetical protein